MKTLLFIGGGLTAGLGDREALGWCGRLTRQLIRERRARHYFNLGIPDEPLPILSKRAQRECTARLEHAEDALIVLEPGHTDLAILGNGRRRTDATTLDAHLDATVRQLQQLAPVIVVGPPPIREESMPYACPYSGEDVRFSNAIVAAAAHRYGDICAPLGVPFIDLFDEMEKAPAYFGALEEADGLHPTTTGHKLIADYLHGEIAFLLEHDADG